MSASLYRKYRPEKFAELVGQDHVSKALQNALSQNRFSHAYLFSGTRGTGKTTTARILGQVLNCENFKEGFPENAQEVEPCGKCDSCVASRAGKSFDVIELDAASNNGVEDMRELIEKVSYSTAAGGTKVYIIDEVHELTTRASNSLLKTLEEPPANVVFILATTNPEKVLPTIRSRTQHFEFNVVQEQYLIQHIKDVLSWENKTLDEETINFVAHKGAGSVRDTLSFLDQVLALGINSFEEFDQLDMSSEVNAILELVTSVASNDLSNALVHLHGLAAAGKEPRAIVEEIISVARDCLVLSLNPDTKVLLSGHNDRDELKNIGDKCGTNFLRNFILQLGKAISEIRSSVSLNPMLNVEMALLNTIQTTSVNAEPKQDIKSAPSPTHVEPKPSPIPRLRPDPAPKDFSSPATTNQAETKKAKATLGAIKSGAANPSPNEETLPPKKITINDIQDSWPKVMGLLSAVSQKALSQLSPQKIVNDVLYFEAPSDQLEEIKSRFKKDASIIRGFIESLHEVTFKFQVVPVDSAKESKEQEKMIEESKEFNAVDHVVEVFGGEVVDNPQ